MNRRLILLLVVATVFSLALGGWWLAQAAASPGNVGYRLETGGRQFQGQASGPGYRLVLPAEPGGTGSPCCCTYLPCVRK